MAYTPPLATEIPWCPVCGASTEGIEVGTRGRFGMAVRNIACTVCSLVYQSPRPTREEMAAYYATGYREHYGEVSYPTTDGGNVKAGQPGYEQALDAWHQSQADNACLLGATKAGDRVLEIGCRHGRTLGLMREALGIIPYGIEPGLEEAEKARRAGITCFVGTLEDYEPGELRFEQIQIFHVLEHLHDPLASLLRMREWLTPGGKLVIEVPNLYQPYGLLEENFFQNAHLTNFSEATLGLLLVRAGYGVERTLDRSALFAVGAPDPAASELPRAFSTELLRAPRETPAWVAERLATYAALEKHKHLLLRGNASVEGLQQIAQLLQRPAFVSHTLNTVTDLVEFFMKQNAPRAAALLATAASMGPHPEEARAALNRLATQLCAVAAAA